MEGFGQRWDTDKYQPLMFDNIFVAESEEAFYYGCLNAGESRTVCFRPLIGIFNQPKSF